MPSSSRDQLAPCASTSSSGLADGLGRRWLAFDREEGAMLERLVVRPELAAFEAGLRDRIDRLAAREDERIARPRTLEHAADGTLVVVSEFVPGPRLADLLDEAGERGAAPGVDAAFGFLLDVLPALCGLHAGAGFAHGTIAPARTVITPAGQVVLLDAIYGDALAHLRYTRRRLWCEFGVAVRPSAGAPRLDRASDVAQAALAAVMLVLGRPLHAAEYAAGLPTILVEATEVAEIRGSRELAHGFRRFLERALPLSGPVPFATADDALIELRELATELGGMHACRRALIDFIDQSVAPDLPEFDEIEPVADRAAADMQAENPLAGTTGPFSLYYESFASIVVEEVEEEPDFADVETGEDTELDLEALVGNGAVDGTEAGEAFVDHAALVQDESYDLDLYTHPGAPAALKAPDDPLSVSQIEASVPLGVETHEPVEAEPGHGVDEPAPQPAGAQPAAAQPAAEPEDEPRAAAGEPRELSQGIAQRVATEPAMAPDASEINTTARLEQRTEPCPAASPHPPDETPAPPALVAAPPAESQDQPADSVEPLQTLAPPPPVRGRRAKRTTRSARARKDKLRSARSADPPDVASAEPPAAKAQPGSWLVRPDRVAAFDPPPAVAGPAPHVVPFPPRPAAAPPPAPTPPPVILYPPVPPPVGPPAPFAAGMPAAPGIPPPYAAVWSSTPNTPPALAAPMGQPGLVPVRLKNPAPVQRAVRTPPAIDIYAAPLPRPGGGTEPVRFPWKIAAAIVAVILIAVVGGRASIPARSTPEASSANDAAIASAAAATPPFVPPAAPTGRLEIATQPAGARVLLNGSPAGDTPLTIEAVPAGRHTVTFVSTSGSVRRTIRVEPGRTVKLDVPIFSGWVGIFAPFVVEVSTGGRVIGTTDEPRLMLSPGRHELTLTNRGLGFRAVQSVDIEPGEVRTITLDPRGTANLNATPWAEVWIDGQKVGDTPLANLKLPLGTREVVFRHPQLGERRATITIKGDVPAALSVHMSR